MPKTPPDVDLLADFRANLGEGPCWVEHEQALYWIDINSCKLFRWSEDQGATTRELTTKLCSIVPRVGGGYIGGSYDGWVAISEKFEISPIADPEPTIKDNRFNDAKVDRKGRLWAGTMDRHERQASGSLYRMDRDLTWKQIDTGYRVTNGPAFTTDGRTMYHTDSAIQKVYAFDLDTGGDPIGRRLFLQFTHEDGYPDGMTVDAEDCLWIAFWDGWCVRRYSPNGEFLSEYSVPVQKPTSVAFGGRDLDKLFISSASRDLTEAQLVAQPGAGGLHAFNPGVTGIAEQPFAG
ncbi:SMP-30/gluconolactonase/LRE family protein [Sphingorhabdus contaminans]|uniref:SMP-30/gluconolactonase/LRE family protein n=1 Tax=Sphingorhabdus contaminans TaxID=1343899 RepID=A0A553WJX7_9SPHN|nr:SMP-30/gluconolactonase/LRE family protein [Sphingorhabdus contaminans]